MRARTDRGFTLLEVLVAFVIAALALVALYQGVYGGLLTARVADLEQEAVSRARSHLAEVGHAIPLAPTDRQGDDGGGFHWHLQITPAATAPVAKGDAAAMAKGPQAGLFHVTVQITWRADGVREVRLDRQMVGNAPPPSP